MDKSERYIAHPSRIPKASGIPRPRSKSSAADRQGQLGSNSIETRSKSAPREMTDRELYQSAQEDEEYIDQNDDDGPSSLRQAPIKRYTYQGISSAKHRPGILINHQPDSLSAKSNFSNTFRNKPDYGTLGSGVIRNNVDPQFPTEDISSMFQRPNTVIPTIPNATAWSKESTKGWASSSKEYQPPMSPNNNSTIGFKSSYSTAEELDNILAKYKAIPTNPPQLETPLEYQVYQNTIHTNYPLDSNYQNANSGVGYHKPKHYERVKKFLEPPPEKVGIFGLPLDNNSGQTYPTKKTGESSSKNSNKGNIKHSQRLFPFKETPEGDLIIHPDQIAFESKGIVVLVSDPSKIWSIKSEKVQDLRNQDQLLKEIEDVIQNGLNKFYDSHAIDDKNNKENDSYRKSLDNEYQNKELVSGKYSDAKTGTEKLLMDLHHRLRSSKHADTHIMIENKIYPCHSVLLECVSKFFDNLTRSRDTLRRIELPDSEVPATVFPILMDWILQNDHGRSVTINKTNVVPLFSCAKYLDISELKSQCVNYLHEKVETNDRQLMPLWEEVKKRPNCHELMVVISAKAALSFQHIFKERKFINLDVDELVMLLSSDDIVIDSELDVFNTAVQWLLHAWENRKIFTNEIINTVRFGLLTALQLTQIAHSPGMGSGATGSKEYPELLAYGSVKAMIDDGLAFSIVNASYNTQPEEIKKWVVATGIKEPRPRSHANPTSRTKIFIMPHDNSLTGNNVIKPLDLDRRPSYTIFKTDQETFSRTSSNSQESPRNKNSVLRMFDTSSLDDDHARKSSDENSRGNTLDSLADQLGAPIRNEDIQRLGPGTRPRSNSSNASSGSRSRSNSRDRNYH